MEGLWWGKGEDLGWPSRSFSILNRCFPGRFEGRLLPGTGLLRPGLPRNRAVSRALPGRSAAAARLRSWRWGKTARKPAKPAC